jgi:hypothetical protein
MEPVVLISTPPYSSDDPASEGLKMVPIIDDSGDDVDHPESDISDEDTDDLSGDLKAGEWVQRIDAAQDQDALDAVLEAYGDSGKDFKTVEEAADRRQKEIDDQ